MKINKFFYKETDFAELNDFRNQWQAKIDEQIRMEEDERRSKLNQKKKALESMGDSSLLEVI